MKITRDNLDEVQFENQDARLLIEDVVVSTSASLYYYHDGEITVQKALEIWYKAQAADSEVYDSVTYNCVTAGELPQMELPGTLGTDVKRRMATVMDGFKRRVGGAWGCRAGAMLK